MSEVHLAPSSMGAGLQRLFQTTNPDRLGCIRIVLDGSVTTDRDVNGGSVWVTVTDPDFQSVYAGRIDSNPEIDPSIHVEDAAIATAFIAKALERLGATSQV